VNSVSSVVETSLATGYNQMVTDCHHRRHRAHGGRTEDAIIPSPTRNSGEPLPWIPKRFSIRLT